MGTLLRHLAAPRAGPIVTAALPPHGATGRRLLVGNRWHARICWWGGLLTGWWWRFGGNRDGWRQDGGNCWLDGRGGGREALRVPPVNTVTPILARAAAGTWNTHEIHLNTHGIHLEYTWNTPGIHMKYTWNTHEYTWICLRGDSFNAWYWNVCLILKCVEFLQTLKFEPKWTRPCSFRLPDQEETLKGANHRAGQPGEISPPRPCISGYYAYSASGSLC
jgi:hypothetical protein